MCFLAFLCAGCRGGDDTKHKPEPRASNPPPNILFITIDTLRADYVGKIGNKPITPIMDQVANNGVLFTRCISAESITGPSIASIMTGIIPHRIDVQYNAVTLHDKLFTLAEILSFGGYETAGFPGASLVSSDYGFDQGFDAFVESFDRTQFETNYWRAAEPVTDDVLKWIQGRDASKPFFMWVHYFDPHAPYNAHYGERAGESYTYEELYKLYIAQDPARVDAEINDILNFYAQEVYYTDQQIGRIIQYLQMNALLDNTMIVITADHGEELFMHDLFHGHGRTLNDIVLNVPLIIRFPHRRYAGRRVDSVVRTIDIFPTILGQAGRGVPEPVQGRSLFPLATGAEKGVRTAFSIREPIAFYQDGHAASMTTAEWKYIYFHNGPGRLFHIVEDPGEFTDLSKLYPDIEKRMKNSIFENIFNDPGYIHPVEPELSGVDRRLLNELGYIR